MAKHTYYGLKKNNSIENEANAPGKINKMFFWRSQQFCAGANANCTVGMETTTN